MIHRVILLLVIAFLTACAGVDEAPTEKALDAAQPLALQNIITASILPTDSSLNDLYRVQVDPGKT